MDGQATISAEILASYAADAAREVAGIRGLAESPLPGRGGVRISGEDEGLRVELHVVVAWGASIPGVGREVQEHVREYLQRMVGARPAAVEVVVDEIGPRA